MTEKILQFSLLENARSSLSHAILHLISENEPTSVDIKYGILDVTHTVELLLKERLFRIHPAFIYSNVDKFPNREAHTVDLITAKKRLLKIAEIDLKKYDKVINEVKELRNTLQHFDVQYPLNKAKNIICRILSFIFYFAETHLDIDLEQEYRADDTWKSLVNIYDFWAEHVSIVEKRQDDDQNVLCCECPKCGAITFDVFEGECAFCEHTKETYYCYRCGQYHFDFDMEYITKSIQANENVCIFCAAGI